MFGKKTIEKYEDEFSVDNMRDKHLFYDLNIRVGDPEEVRLRTAELVGDMDYSILLNEYTKFEDVEFENIFRGGRLKPIKNVVKALKKVELGTRFSFLWKLFALIGLVMILIYFWPQPGINKTNILIITITSFVIGIILFLIKKTAELDVWIKIAGIYDVESGKADIRLLLAADATDKGIYKKIESEVGEMYNELARRYVSKEPPKEKVIKVVKKSPETPYIKALTDIKKEINELNSRIAEGKISEETYNKVKAELEARKDKLETVLDMLSIS